MGGEPGRIGGGRGNWEVGEERVGSGRSKRAGSGREMRNTNFFFFKFNNALQYFQKEEPKIYLTCI